MILIFRKQFLIISKTLKRYNTGNRRSLDCLIFFSNEGIHCIPGNKFTPILSHIHNNRDHRKITVIDGNVGFTGGINLADEYINSIVKYGHWKDTAVKLEGSAVRNLTALFITTWNTQSKEHIDCNAYMSMTTDQAEGNGYLIPFGDGPEPIYKDNIGKSVYLNMINAAKDYLYITTPYLICEHELLNALRIAAKKGVDVRLITPQEIPADRSVMRSWQRLLAEVMRIFSPLF